MERTEYYEAVLAPASFQRMLAANLTAEPSLVSQFSVYRSYRERPFERRDLDRFAPLIPHLQRAAQLRLRLRALEQERSAALSVLDRLPLGVVLVDARAEVTFLNRRAREIIDSQDGLKVQGREIHALDSGESVALRKLVGEAAQTGMRRGTGSGGALLVSRTSAKRPLEILVAPLGEGSVRADARGSAAVIFVSDPEREDEPVPEVLQRLYRLTPAEAAVAVAVAQGRDPRHLAETLRVSVSTVRTHLYRAMAKTGARRQADLVRLLLGGPAGLRPR
jgi:DNA-binding CsgD family transcriptional regulator